MSGCPHGHLRSCPRSKVPVMHTATFFIATARSGTQWICHSLRDVFEDVLAVEHEPIRYAYAPKRCLRNPAALAALRAHPLVRQHLDGIHRTLKDRPYVEVGFPAFAAAPLLLEEFGSHLRLVHLTRHPLRAAASIVTHRWFDPKERPDIMADVALTPMDCGVRLHHYADRWPQMNPFEKALFNWTEVHLYGLEVRNQSTIPVLRVRFEDLLTQKTAGAKFLDFLNLPHRSKWDAAATTIVDSFQKKTETRIDWSTTRTLPEMAELAEAFGYDLEAVSERTLRSRYHQSLAEKTGRRLKRFVRRVATFVARRADINRGLTD
jgi:hypothetical protein